MADEPHEERLKQLEARLERKQATRGSKASAPQAAGWSHGEVAWRMVIEMVSGLMIGLAIGYGLDWLFGTMPILMVIFTVLGLIAGVRTMLGTAAEMNKQPGASGANGTKGVAPAADDERD